MGKFSKVEARTFPPTRDNIDYRHEEIDGEGEIQKLDNLSETLVDTKQFIIKKSEGTGLPDHILSGKLLFLNSLISKIELEKWGLITRLHTAGITNKGVIKIIGDRDELIESIKDELAQEKITPIFEMVINETDT